MQVTIVHTSDAGARVHKAGCADIRRTDLNRRDYISDYPVEVEDRDAAIRDAWGDMLAEGMTMDAARGYTDFLPCTAGLPAVRSYSRADYDRAAAAVASQYATIEDLELKLQAARAAYAELNDEFVAIANVRIAAGQA
jgi:hypothetical protein